jgi:hypothetical protein
MSVFLPRENLFFLEEWLRYHLAIGFGHFFLYDNSGSRWLDNGNSLEVTARNKRGEDVYRLLAHLDDAAVARELDRLLSPFERRGVVTRVSWQPRDAEGRITYGQAAAFQDYVRRFQRNSEWTSFTDLDEFVVPVRHPGMPGVLDELARRKVTYVRLPQRCFASRFDDAGQPAPKVLLITKCSDSTPPSFGPKALIRNDTLRARWSGRFDSIHSPAASGRSADRLLEPDLLRFNHYKFNQWELDWVAANLGHPLVLDCDDRGMERFAPAMAAFSL